MPWIQGRSPKTILRFQWDQPVVGAGGAKGAVVLDGKILTARTVRDRQSSRVVLAIGTDSGRTWSDGAAIVESGSDGPRDLGDGCLLSLGKRRLWYVFRDNLLSASPPRFSIRVCESTDAGKTWAPHSTVAQSAGEFRGHWSPSLVIHAGTVHCLYDDENLPWENGFRRHQWLLKKTWNPQTKTWEAPVVVSRAHDPKHLSRDGMGTASVLSDGEWVATLESVGTDPLHASVVRTVRSSDGGRTWSWVTRERSIIHEGNRPKFSAYAPWLTRLPNGHLACVFTSNERQETHDAPGTPAHRLHGDVLMRLSTDGGRTWSGPTTIYQGGGRNYMPQLVVSGQNQVALLCLDFALDKFVCVPGRWK